jgi:hypothetical protein
MTDIKITTKNPLNALPFSYTYKTGSSEWNDWYEGMQSSAFAYDDKNIHSFVSNLPDAIGEDSDAGDLKQFLNMTGEQFDLVRNYIDNYQSFYKRRYDKLDSVPTNLLPILANNLGWDVTQILTGSLSQYFGTSQEDIKVGGRTVEEITHNTWRKVLNNLIYIYKTKGTLTGVNALLNVYGYPGDILKIQEIGGSAQEHNPTHITDDITKLLEGAGGLSGNASFIKFADELYSWIFNNNARTLNFDWWTNSTTNLNTVEFILKPHRCLNNDQIILESSGSGAEKLWDVRLLASSSDATIGKLQFRLNNTLTGSSAIASNAVSMSTDYLPLKTNNNLWNVMLQRATSSISGTGIQTYKLFAGLQYKDKITQFSAVSMSVSGGASADANYYANQNWLNTGSLSTAVSGNLYIGRTYTGSLAEFRTWTTILSASKFKQHILNKKSTVGNNIDASRDEVTYRYSLQENWKRNSASPKIEDANPNNVKDYTFNISTDLLTGSVLYDRDDIDIVKFSIRVGGSDQPDDNKIIMNPLVDITSNLSAERSSETSPYSPDKYGEIKRYHTSKLQLVRSPQKVLNEFIIDNLADYDISGKFADPQDLYETYYNDLNKLRDDLFNHFNVTIDINKWIRAQVNIFNPPIIESIQRVLPARSTIQNVGVMFEPTLLERDKMKNPQVSIATGSAAGQLGFIHDMVQYYDLEDSAYLDIKTNPNPIEVASDISLVDSMYVSSKDGEYSVADLIDEKGFYLDVKNVEYNIESSITKEMSYLPSKDIEIGFIDSTVRKGKIISTKPIPATATITITDYTELNTGDKVNLIATDGTNYDFTNGDQSSVNGTWESADSNTITATNLMNVINTASGPAGTRFTATSDGAVVTVTQATGSALGNTTVDLTDSGTGGMSKTDFTGGTIKYIRAPDETKSPIMTQLMTYQPSKDVEYDIESSITKEMSYQPSKDVEYDIESNITKEILYEPSRNVEYDVEDSIAKEMVYQPSKDIEIGFIDSTVKKGKIISTKPIPATATITITDYTELNTGDKVNLIATDGTNYDFTNGDQSSVNGTWESTDSNADTATNLMNVINTSSGPAGTRFTATSDGAVVTVTQSTGGTSGNTTVDLTDSGTAGMSKTDFTGGTAINSKASDETNSPIIIQTMTYQPFKDIEYDVESNIAKDITYELSKNGEYNVYNPIIETGNIEDIIEGEESWVASQSYASFVNLADSWGTSSDDTHFLAPNSASKLANIGYYEQDFTFKIVGDVEFILGQYKKNEFSPLDLSGENRMDTYRVDYRKVNFNDASFFLNREMRDKGKGYTYDSYIGKHPSQQDGRPVGKTSYYATRSNGDLVYPSNHWIHYSEDSLRSNFIKGTQNKGGHYMQLNKWRDYSTASFYSISVTGESGLEVVRGVQTIGSDGRVDRGGV